MNDTTHMLFVVLKVKGGRKEVLLVRGGEENPDEWGFPIAALGKNPTHEKIEMVLRERHFREITLETVKEIHQNRLSEESKSRFRDIPIYECKIIGETVSCGIGLVFFGRPDNINGFNLSERTSVLFSSLFVQSRLS
ncbi:MAG: hypothetical protein AAB775_01205 [Patescibacteria group bacterium]